MFFIPTGTTEGAPRKTFPYITILIVLLNIAVFLIEYGILASQGEGAFQEFVNQYAYVPLHPFGITLLTAIFLHAGLLHIAGNMVYLLPFGDNVEDRLGHMHYLFFYLFCGVAASLIYAAFNQGSATPLVGASGAIAGVLGGYIALHPRRSQVKGFLWIIIVLFPIRLPAILFIGYWFVMQLFSTVASLGVPTEAGGGVAFLAHVGGFIVGLIIAPLLAKRVSQSTPITAD